MSTGPEPQPDALTELVRILRDQLNRKDERIAALEARLEEANQRVSEQQHMMACLLERNIAALAPSNSPSVFTPSLAAPPVRRAVPTRARTVSSREEAPEHPASAQAAPMHEGRPPEAVMLPETDGIDHATALVFDTLTPARSLPLPTENTDPDEYSLPSGQILDAETEMTAGDYSLTPAVEEQDGAEITARLDRRALRRGHRELAAANTAGRRRFWPWRARTGRS